MKRFYLITNKDKDPDFELTNHIKAYLEQFGCSCVLRSEQETVENGRIRYTVESDVPEDTQCIIVLGGDGTLLRAARDLRTLNIPYVGINIGTLGYLAEIDRNNVDQALNRLIEDNYFVEERMMLAGHIIKNDVEELCDSALNDIVLARNNGLHLIEFNIYVNGQLLSHYSADGIIVSTPTGSTSYNLSAGGPIVMPGAHIIVVTPVSPHTLNNKSIVLSSDAVIELELTKQRGIEKRESLVAFDGSTTYVLEQGDRVRITQSKYNTKILKLSKASFLDTLSNKMS